MSDAYGKPASLGDIWATPQPVFAALNAEFDFIVDVCATAENAKCALYISQQHNALNIDWREFIASAGGRIDYTPSPDDRYPAWCWCNPPYSDISPWIAKAAHQSAKGNLGVVMLVMADISVGWFAEALQTVSEIRILTATPKASGRGHSSGRIAFLGSGNKPISGNNRGSLLLIWRPGISGNGSPVTRYEPLAALEQRGQAWLDAVRNESTKFDGKAA